jgi:hypothetical protein
MVLEEAIKHYGRKTGFVFDDGTLVARQDLLHDPGPDYPGGGIPVAELDLDDVELEKPSGRRM